MNEKITEYIDNAQPFAQPILWHFRDLIHKVCPKVEEKLKWGVPFFDYKGSMCFMAGFKNHCNIGFWKGAIMQDALLFTENNTKALGGLNKIKAITDLPNDDTLMAYIAEAMILNENGVKVTPAFKKIAVPEMPKEFTEALQNEPIVLGIFEGFTPSQRKEYILWIASAKTEATKSKRILQAIDWIADGKIKDWKYVK